MFLLLQMTQAFSSLSPLQHLSKWPHPILISPTQPFPLFSQNWFKAGKRQQQIALCLLLNAQTDNKKYGNRVGKILLPTLRFICWRKTMTPRRHARERHWRDGVFVLRLLLPFSASQQPFAYPRCPQIVLATASIRPCGHKLVTCGTQRR